MQALIINISQGNTECKAAITLGLNGKLNIEIAFYPTFPTIGNTIMERITSAIYNEVKRINKHDEY